MQIFDRLREITAELRGEPGEINAALAGLSDEELLRGMAAVEAIARVISAGQLQLADEIEARSRIELDNKS